ncbi:MAG: sigma-54-dependent Fis family transcriptional regulator [Bdellovibrionaceae bacterium]|jgi:DNA-binding NtrC family response regulator|nr:sigma-54-dependent Fis family transcriptional regulator [Pseudobdellovibrionaceae bacterium]
MKITDSKPLVLVVDDEKNIRNSVEIALENEGIETIQAHDAALALRSLSQRIVDVIILDIRLGDTDGLSLFRQIRGQGCDQPVIFISGHASLTEAAQTVKMGAYDFIEKPFGADKIVTTIKRCLEYDKMSKRIEQLNQLNISIEIIGESQIVKKLIAEAEKVAITTASVLVTGESGTGKELVANLIHEKSKRCSSPLIKVNCSAIPENLIESELFGHEKGAFTGADYAKKGLFERAHRGSIFLDEVADLSLSAQAKVLRVLQDGDIQKVGSEKSLRVDVRIISGTHKDLKRLVQQGNFREDLYYRLNVVPINVPSLKERQKDISLLIYFFLKQLSQVNNLKEKKIEDAALNALEQYSWPGNIRELKNMMERILIMSGEMILLGDLPEHIFAISDKGQETSDLKSLKDFRDQAERDFIIKVLKSCSGNITQASAQMSIGRTYLHKRLDLLKIEKRDYLL